MIIYKTVNNINGKSYIGQSKDNNPNYYGSGTLIEKAIKKYGKDNFTKYILVENIPTFELLDELEIHFIHLYATTINGYNIMKGGRGNKPSQNSKIAGYKRKPVSDKTRKKMSESAKKKIISKSTREKHSKNLKGNTKRLGIPHSEEVKAKISKSIKDLKNTEEYKIRSKSFKRNIENNVITKMSKEEREVFQKLATQKAMEITSRKVTLTDIFTNEILEFPSINSVIREYKSSIGHLTNCFKKGILFREKYKVIITNSINDNK